MTNVKDCLTSKFRNEFGSLLWSHAKDYTIQSKDLEKSHAIINSCIFDNKLEPIKFTIEDFTGQKAKGSFRAGYIAKTDRYKQDMKFVREHGKDNFFKIVCVLMHEMIHQYDFNFGRWNKFVNRLELKTDYVKKQQTIEDYDIHNNKMFDSFMNMLNNAGFNVQKLYNRNDNIFMRETETTNLENSFINEDIDEEPIENRNIISTDYAKNMYDRIKTDGYKNFVTKPDGSWMIEVE